MNKRPFLAAFLSLGLLSLLSGPSQAQEFRASYSKRFDNGSLSLSVGTSPSHSYGRSVYAPSKSYGRRGHYGRRPIRSTPYYGRRVWIAGYYEVVNRKVWVPGYSERIWVEPVYDVTCDAYGNQVSVLLSAGRYKTLRHPGRYELRRERVWRPGYWGRR